MVRATSLMVVLAAVMLIPAAVPAADAVTEIPITIEKSRFQPAEIRVKAGAPFVLLITNKDAKPAEFESKELRVEKVVPAGKTLRVPIRALKPGTYPFVDDFNRQNQGKIVAE
jgi:uncharacterized protein (DUF2141 family)